MLDAFSQTLDLYCERTGPEFWAEPINALSNLAFIAAGIWGVWLSRRNHAGALAECLGWWTIAVGIGSGLFHTFANEGTKWLDILPIVGLTLAYALINLRRFLELSWPRSLAIFIAFYVVAALLTAAVPNWLRLASNGSTGYLPAFLTLVVFGVATLRHGSPTGWYSLAGAALFCLSVTLRAIDMRVCADFPLGTHFLWHTINAAMLGLLLTAVARHSLPTAPTLTSRR